MTDRIRSDVRFAIMPEWVLFHPDLSHAAVRIYGALVRHANSADEAWPSKARLSRECHCSPSTVKRAISDLLVVGAVEREPRYEDGRQVANLYTVYTVPPLDRGEGATSDPGGRSPMTPPGGSPVTREEREPEEREKPLSSGDDDGEPYTMSHDEAFDVLADVCGYDAEAIRKTGGALIGKSAKRLRELRVSAGEVRRRARRYRTDHADWELTPAALVKWWPTLDRPSKPPDSRPRPPLLSDDGPVSKTPMPEELRDVLDRGRR